VTDIHLRSDVIVELVKHTAADADVLWAARVSTAGEHAQAVQNDTSLTARDKGLINYLMRDRHGSPFEHNSMTFLISAPIFVFREFMRHRVGWSYNEESGRYRELEPVFYIPGPDRRLVQEGRPGKYVSPRPAHPARAGQGPVLPAAGDRDGRRADGGPLGPADAADARGVQRERPGRALTGRSR
jgi:flavin-dependent thymidylate synthase